MAQELPGEEYFPGLVSEKGDILQSVQRALRVLSLIAEHPRGLSARQISNALQLNISTCYHVLNTLAADGYVHRHPAQQIYQLGPQIPFLNNAFIQGLASQEGERAPEESAWPSGLMSSSLVKRLRPIMYRLTELTQEPSYLGCWHYGEVIFLAIVEAPQAPKLTELYVGFQGPAHCHALGKTLLAYSEPAFVDRYLDLHPLTSIGPNTIVQRLKFQDELNAIVAQGYSIDQEEFSGDTYCIAAPILSLQGEVAAALAISFTRGTFTRRSEWLISQVTRSAQHACAELRLSPVYRS